MNTGLRLYLDFVVFVFGAAIGSFLNVCIHRMPRGESIVNPRSHCPNCNAQIRWMDNIPLVSYFALRGKCRYCGAPISPRYFLVELLTASAFLLVTLEFGWQWTAPIYWVLLGGLIAASFIDFEHYIIPNELTYSGVIVGLILSAAHPPLQRPDFLSDAVLRLLHLASPAWAVALLRSFLGMLCGGLILFIVAECGKLAFGRLKVQLPPGTTARIADNTFYFGEESKSWEEIFSRGSDRIRFHASTLKFHDQTFENAGVSVSMTAIEVNGTPYSLTETGPVEATTSLVVIPREAMGLGDAKLLAAIGAFLGLYAVLFSVFFSSVVGGIVSLLLVIMRRKEWQSRIPYGPYLALAAAFWIFWGPNLVNWYLGFMRR